MRPLPIAALALLAAPLGQAEETSAHLGPVTGVALVGGQVYSVSQAGIFSGARRLAKPPFRVMSMAASKPLLLVGGGQPAASGEIAALEPDGRVLTIDFPSLAPSRFRRTADGSPPPGSTALYC